MTLDVDTQRALTEMGRVVDGLLKERDALRARAEENVQMLITANKDTGRAFGWRESKPWPSIQQEIRDLRAKLETAERERDVAKRAVQDVAATQREACAASWGLYTYGHNRTVKELILETPLVTGEAPKRTGVYRLGDLGYGMSLHCDQTQRVVAELARWDDEPEPTIGERVEIYCRAIQELAALRKREADKLSAIAADIAPLNPPAPDTTVRRDGMVCTCGESERRWHLRDCPMSSAGKTQQKEGEK